MIQEKRSIFQVFWGLSVHNSYIPEGDNHGKAINDQNPHRLRDGSRGPRQDVASRQDPGFIRGLDRGGCDHAAHRRHTRPHRRDHPDERRVEQGQRQRPRPPLHRHPRAPCLHHPPCARGGARRYGDRRGGYQRGVSPADDRGASDPAQLQNTVRDCGKQDRPHPRLARPRRPTVHEDVLAAERTCPGDTRDEGLRACRQTLRPRVQLRTVRPGLRLRAEHMHRADERPHRRRHTGYPHGVDRACPALHDREPQGQHRRPRRRHCPRGEGGAGARYDPRSDPLRRNPQGRG